MLVINSGAVRLQLATPHRSDPTRRTAMSWVHQAGDTPATADPITSVATTAQKAPATIA